MANKYTAAQLKALGAAGKAFRNPDGTFSYPTADRDDLDKAIKAVGRGGASHNAIRKYIIGRAKLMGLSKMIPTNWSADGSLKTATSRTDHGVELRRHLLGTAEVRTYTADIELRDDDPSGHFVTVRGTPIVYNTPYSVYDGIGPTGSFTERMKPGCVRDLLQKGTDTVLAINHDMKAIPLARTNGGGLELEDSPSGLTFRAQLDVRQTAAADLAVAIENRVLRQMSIGMIVSKDSWNAAQTEREVHALGSLHDISAVTFPASPATSIALANRSAGHRMHTSDLRREHERDKARRRSNGAAATDRAKSDRAFRAETNQLVVKVVVEEEQRRVDREIEQLEDGARYALTHGDLVRARLLRMRARRLRDARR